MHPDRGVRFLGSRFYARQIPGEVCFNFSECFAVLNKEGRENYCCDNENPKQNFHYSDSVGALRPPWVEELDYNRLMTNSVSTSEPPKAVPQVNVGKKFRSV